MTEKAIKLLSRHRKGYFLMIEGGRIDHGHHITNAHRALTDTIAFSDAVATAVQMSTKNTLIVVTADHSHTMTIGGYSARGNSILGKVSGVNESGEPTNESSLDDKGQAYTTLSYANGPVNYASNSQAASANANQAAAGVDTEANNYFQVSTVPLMYETHSGEDVVVYAQGPGAAWFHGVIEQNVIYWLMRGALRMPERAP